MANPSLQIGNSNWAIKEDNLLGYSTAGTRFVPQPITMTRESAGTRVNSSGLVETVELLGSELIVNGDFSNGLTDWTENGGSYATIVNGALNSNNPDAGNWYAENISQNVSFVNGTTYKLTFKAKNISGNLNLRITQGANAMASLDLTSTFVDYTYFYTANADNGSIRIFCNSSIGEFQIDNISVKESTKNNLARVDYDGTASSLLAEPQRTNLVTYSEELQSTTNVTLSNTISPDGTLNGLKINETTSNSQHYATSYSAAVVSGTIYTVSFYIKKGTYDLVKVYTQSSRISASINITFSTESTSASGSDFISGSNFMEDAGNGWYRVGFSATANSTGEVSIYLSIKDLSTYVGDISQYTEYWGASLEVGSYPTSYIPTSGSTVTRVKDQYSKTGISNLINSEEGVLFAEIASLSESGNYRELGLSDGTTSNRVLISYKSTDNVIRGSFQGSGGANLEYTVTSSKDFHKIAVKWKVNDFALWVDGVEVGSDTSGSSFPADTLNSINFNSGSGGDNFYGKVKQLQVFKTALTDSELATLTT